MVVPFSRPDPSSAAAIAEASFGTSRRGYDPGEVRDFLRMVAAELARLQERERFLEREVIEARRPRAIDISDIDEDTFTALLGEETARVLRTARESAAQIKARADEAADRLLREAQDEAAKHRAQAELEAAHLRDATSREAAAELDTARREGREMVEEARLYRERVIGDLNKRRDASRQQLTQLTTGRDRIISAFDRARMAANDVIAEMQALGDEPDDGTPLASAGPPTAAAAAAAAGHTVARSTAETAPFVAEAGSDSEIDAVLSRAADAAPTTLVPAPTAAPLSDADGDPHAVDDATAILPLPLRAADAAPTTLVPAPIAAPMPDLDGDVGGDINTEAALHDPRATLVEPSTSTDETISSASTTGVHADHLQQVDHATAHRSDDIDEQAAPPTDVADDGHLAPVVELFSNALAAAPRSAAAPRRSIDDLFARLRSAPAGGGSDESTEPASDGGAAAQAAPSNANPPSAVVASPLADSTAASTTVRSGDPVSARDDTLSPIVVETARRLKRVLADEQNDVLDLLRRREPVTSVDTMLPSSHEQVAEYAASTREPLHAAAVAGTETVSSDPAARRIRRIADAGVIDALLVAVTTSLVEPLRERLDHAVRAAGGDNNELASQARGIYREWKNQRIDDLALDLACNAYRRGAIAVIVPGTAVRWAADPHAPHCPDADDVTDAIMPGHHVDCRCVVTVASPR